MTGSSGTSYIFAADRWTTGDLGSSPLVWLPITHNEGSNNVLNVGWFNSWALDIGSGTWTAKSSLPSGTKLTSANSPSGQSLVMDVQYGWTIDNQPIDQYQSNGQQNQQWNLIQQGAGNTYTLTSAHATAECLDRQLNPNQLVQYTCHSPASSAPWAEWIFNAVGSAYDGKQTYTMYELKNLDSGLVVDVPGKSTKNGVVLDLYADNGGLNQQWTIS